MNCHMCYQGYYIEVELKEGVAPTSIPAIPDFDSTSVEGKLVFYPTYGVPFCWHLMIPPVTDCAIEAERNFQWEDNISPRIYEEAEDLRDTVGVESVVIKYGVIFYQEA